MLFVSNRDITVRSKKCGQSIAFEKGVVTRVPAAMHEECMEKGILPVEADGSPVDPANNTVSATPLGVKLAPEDGDTRSVKILEVIQVMVKRNNSKDFTGGGRPLAKSVSMALGWTVDQKDVNAVWEKSREKILTPVA